MSGVAHVSGTYRTGGGALRGIHYPSLKTTDCCSCLLHSNHIEKHKPGHNLRHSNCLRCAHGCAIWSAFQASQIACFCSRSFLGKEAKTATDRFRSVTHSIAAAYPCSSPAQAENDMRNGVSCLEKCVAMCSLSRLDNMYIQQLSGRRLGTSHHTSRQAR